MGRLNNISRVDDVFLSSNDVSSSSNKLLTIKHELANRRKELLKVISALSSQILLDTEIVHDLNFQITEYVFWSHFIFCESFKSEIEQDYEEIKEHTVAMSYLCSAIQFAPQAKEAISHLITRFTDRFEIEDRLIEHMLS